MGSTGATRSMSKGTTKDTTTYSFSLAEGNGFKSYDIEVPKGLTEVQERKFLISSVFDIVDVPVYDKWGDYMQTDTGYTDGRGNLYSVTQNGSLFNVNIGDTSRGFVAVNSGLSEQEAWSRMWRYLRGIK